MQNKKLKVSVANALIYLANICSHTDNVNVYAFIFEHNNCTLFVYILHISIFFSASNKLENSIYIMDMVWNLLLACQLWSMSMEQTFS